MDRAIERVWIARTFVILLTVVHFSLAFQSARIKSPTIDEYTYIASGYYYVKTGDFRLDRTHPPLMRLLVGLPLQFMTVNEPNPQTERWNEPIGYELGYFIGKDMLLEQGNDVRAILLAARLPIVLLSCGLAGLIYLWAKDLYGAAGGLTALFLYVLCPNMLAHARFATLDLGVSFFLVLTLFALYRYTKKPTLLRLTLSGIALGAALAAKATALVLLPVFLGTIAWLHLTSKPSIREFPIVECAKRFAIVLASATILLFLVYGFPFKPFYYLDTLNNVIQKSLGSGKGGQSIPGMPHRNYAFYLWGNYSTSGWPYYYLAAAAVKTPLAVLAALGLYLIFGARRWRGLPDGIIIGAILTLHAFAALNRVNIGLRHVLPFYPLLYLYMGRIIELSNRRVWAFALTALGIWYAAACAFIYPDFLSYFNEAAGGPERGHQYLDDSNVDWGQDLGRLANVRSRYPNESFYIAQEYIFDPAAYGFSAVPFRPEQIGAPPKGIVAVSKHWAIRHRIQQRSPNYFDWIGKYEPIECVGRSIWIFRFE